MNKKCTKCNKTKDLSGFYYRKNRDNYSTVCRVCQCKRGKELVTNDYYTIYYLPEENYCGVTKSKIEFRIRKHKNDGRNVKGYYILQTCKEMKEAYYIEAMFQSVLGMEGLNANRNLK